MTIGSQEHKEQFLESLKQQAQENIWRLEIERMEHERILKQLEQERDEAKDMLDKKLYKSAREGKDILKAKEELVIQATVAIGKCSVDIERQKLDMETVEAYQKQTD